ncbi:hypothetical protein A0H81_03216 [Grifola frondosa]|uniref:Fungal-type protein kinase domain-containing protein n=1 Tax=Grifola frondosa TaxID=5627 RepID=A0A1C7MGY0_GRIFR|nr:hypothetical protein A0H81_03216 [Grifola frondosa]
MDYLHLAATYMSTVYQVRGTCFGRRTTVFETPKSVEEFAIIKEYYRDDKHRSCPSHFIETVTIPSNDVNNALENNSKKVSNAIYDILEVHRNVAMKRGVLHRDMSLHNILMYPEHREIQGKCIMENPPKFIDDLLGVASKNSAQADHSRCLMIDLDNAAKLLNSEQSQIDNDELTCRIGTPVYIARSVSAGAIWNRQQDALSFSPMPELFEKAAQIYFKFYPERRQYDDNIPGWCHGSPAPTDTSTLYKAREWIKFRHRMEHDAESIFWTLISVILRAQPQDVPVEEEPSRDLLKAWNALQDHEIDAMAKSDSRDFTYFCPAGLGGHPPAGNAVTSTSSVRFGQRIFVPIPETISRISTVKRPQPNQGGREEPKRRRSAQEKSKQNIGGGKEARRRRYGQKKSK